MLPCVNDMSGMIAFAEIQAEIPFEIKRFFLIYEVPGSEIRSKYARCTKTSSAYTVPVFFWPAMGPIGKNSGSIQPLGACIFLP